MKTGVELIAEERARQIAKEGWTPEHDDEHASYEMSQAAMAYIEHAREQGAGDRRVSQHVEDSIFGRLWPWHPSWWKPRDRRSNLVRAGALIAAEIDRLQRAE